MKVDILIVLDYPMNHPAEAVIRTNANTEGLEEVLECWLRNQGGREEDNREPAQRDRYEVKIGLRVEDDAFATEHNCGNHGLACGLIMDVYNRLGDVEVKEL